MTIIEKMGTAANGPRKLDAFNLTGTAAAIKSVPIVCADCYSWSGSCRRKQWNYVASSEACGLFEDRRGTAAFAHCAEVY
jgi:hypothetical protein